MVTCLYVLCGALGYKALVDGLADVDTGNIVAVSYRVVDDSTRE